MGTRGADDSARRAAAGRMTVHEWAAMPEDEPGELCDGLLEREDVADLTNETAVLWRSSLLRAWIVAAPPRRIRAAGAARRRALRAVPRQHAAAGRAPARCSARRRRFGRCGSILCCASGSAPQTGAAGGGIIGQRNAGTRCRYRRTPCRFRRTRRRIRRKNHHPGRTRRRTIYLQDRK